MGAVGVAREVDVLIVVPAWCPRRAGLLVSYWPFGFRMTKIEFHFVKNDYCDAP
jgi:hypothetical protein